MYGYRFRAESVAAEAEDEGHTTATEAAMVIVTKTLRHIRVFRGLRVSGSEPPAEPTLIIIWHVFGWPEPRNDRNGLILATATGTIPRPN
jgi:hypothetical protein